MKHRYRNLEKLHLPPVPEDAAGELLKVLDALVDDYGADKIIAFGSCVRGDVSEHSDLDLCVVRDHPPGSTHPRWEGRQAVARRHPRLGFDLLVLNGEQWENQQHSPFGVYGEIVQRGLPLYER